MSTQLTCACGNVFSGEPGEPVQCPGCGNLFVCSDGSSSSTAAQSAFANIAGWGCVWPVGILLLILGTQRLIWNKSYPGLAILGAIAILPIFAHILRVNRYSRRTMAAVITISALAYGSTTFYLVRLKSTQTALDNRFSKFFSLAQSKPESTIKADAAPMPKFLPLVLKERGIDGDSTTHVCVEVYEGLPSHLRAETPDEVRSVVLLKWWHEAAGIYHELEDKLNIRVSRIFRGGCTLDVVDVESGRVIHTHSFSVPDNAPETRMGDDALDWYGPQPTVKEILDYIQEKRW